MATEKGPAHKTPDNDNDYPPSLPMRVKVPMPVPDHQPMREPLWV